MLLLILLLAVLTAFIVNVVLFLLRRHRTRRALMERVAAQEALIAAGRALVAAELDLDALCGLIAEQAGQVIDNRTFQVGLFHEGFYEIRYWTIDGRHQPVPQCFDIRADHPEMSDAGGLVGWVHDTQRPLLVRDFEREMDRLPARPTYESAAPPRLASFCR